MKQIFRIFTLIAVAMLTAGQAWAGSPADLGSIKTGTVTGGTLKFYKEATCVNEIAINEELYSGDLTEGTIYIKATPDWNYTAVEVTITAQVSISSSSLEARAITRGTEIGIGEAITVNPVSGKPGIYSFTMPADGKNVTVSATFKEKPYLGDGTNAHISYYSYDAQGNRVTSNTGDDGHPRVYILDGNETTLGQNGTDPATSKPYETWYVVPSTATGNNALSYKGQLKLNGDVHLILADGGKMTADGTGDDPEMGPSTALDAVDNGQLTIYGQTNGTGELNAITGSGSKAFNVTGTGCALTICGGVVNVEANTAFNGTSLIIYGGKFTTIGATNCNSINTKNVQINGGEVSISGSIQYSGTGVEINGGQVSVSGSILSSGSAAQGIEINGGQVDVTGSIKSGGDIILDWTNATDHIKAASYQPNTDQDHYVKIADGKVLKYTDGTVKLLHSGIVAPSSISGKELTPYGIFGYCGKTSENDGKNVYWSIALNDDSETDDIFSNELVIEKNNNTVNQTDFSMADYANNAPGNFAPWIKPDADEVRSDGLKYPITTVTIADGVTSIGASAFDNCSGLQNVTIGNSVTTIGNKAFAGCSGLQSVTIPASVTTINGNAFYNCEELQSVTIGNSVTAIGSNIFGRCNNLKLILVPNEAAYDAYKSADGWRDYAAKIAPNEISLAKNASGWGTYCHRYPVSYSLSDGATAYTVTGLNSTNTAVTISSALSNIAPYTPLLLNYTAPDNDTETDDENVTLTALLATATTVSDGAIVNNGGTDVVFYGNTTGTTQKHDPYSATADGIPALTSSNNACYILLNGKFVLVDTDDGIPAHRCVLSISNSNAARVLAIGIDDETTGVESEKVIVNSEEFAAATVWYDLQGRKLDGKPTKKGLYIYKGKKIVVK